MRVTAAERHGITYHVLLLGPLYPLLCSACKFHSRFRLEDDLFFKLCVLIYPIDVLIPSLVRFMQHLKS